MFACPKCRSKNLVVAVLCWAELEQDEDDADDIQTNVGDSDHEWDENSIMECRKCGYAESSGDFNSECVNPK